jgi:hypothetical protein
VVLAVDRGFLVDVQLFHLWRSTLLVSAFVVGSEVAQGLFFMLAPAGIGFFFSLRNGRRILKSELQPEELRAAVMRQRRTNQFIGAVGVIVCAIFFALKYSDRIVFLSH